MTRTRPPHALPERTACGAPSPDPEATRKRSPSPLVARPAGTRDQPTRTCPARATSRRRAREPRSAPSPDYGRVFRLAPARALLLTPDLAVVDANRACLESTATTLEATVARQSLDVLPPDPDDPPADGPAGLRQSLERARDTRRPDTVPLQRYDVRTPDGSYGERFWSYRTVPVLDERGEVVLLLAPGRRHHRLRPRPRRRQPTATRGLPLAARVQRAEADLLARTRELEQANAELRASSDRERRTAEQLAGLAATVSALSVAESRSNCSARCSATPAGAARRRAGRGPAGAGRRPPGRGGLPRPVRSIGPPAAPAPLAGADGGGGRRRSRSTSGTRVRQSGRAAPGTARLGGPPAAHRPAPARVAHGRLGATPAPSTTTTSVSSRPSPRSAPRRSTGSPAGRPSGGRPGPRAASPRASSGPC